MKENIEKMIDDALRTEPLFQLRKDFKDRVVEAVRKQEKTSLRRVYLWIALGVLVIFGFGYGTIAYFMPTVFDNFNTMKDGFGQIIPFAVLIGIMITLIQYLDKRLVQKKLYTS